ncbi:hypothetical protein QLQ12_45665 [Actinoplanes sp. NEAU-A12]|uniref:Uncharacterized protein n=1 Tax=Actinoplanes sandaracinus TaxID=3045177 RepID=A0ABT6X1K2_9ACTN|nr:hypothetical protein [Actinoplanes sandaracinus]MDI6105884.1 hypothetical protein [Actinoplanes sandaracinus]
MERYAELDGHAEPAPEDQHIDLTPGEIRLRRLMAAGGVAAVVIGLAVGVPLLTRSEPPAQWNKPDWAEPVFPFQASWLPPGRAEPTVFRSGPDRTLQYYYGDGNVLTAEWIARDPTWDHPKTEEHAAVVGDRPATVRTAPGRIGVLWQLADGRWMKANGSGGWTEQDVLRFAGGLQPGSVPSGPAPFSFAEVPQGLTLQNQTPWSACLATPEKANTVPAPTGLCVSVLEPTFPSEPLPDPQPVTVGGLTAQYQKYPVGGEMRLDLGGRRTLMIRWEGDIRLDRDGIVRFASGITAAG